MIELENLLLGFKILLFVEKKNRHLVLLLSFTKYYEHKFFPGIVFGLLYLKCQCLFILYRKLILQC